MKICTKCNKEKPLREFYSNGRGNLRSECKACTLAARPIKPSALSGRRPSKEELYTLYCTEQKSYGDIAEIYGVSRTAIGHWVKKHGLSPRSKSHALLIALEQEKIEGHRLHRFNRSFFNKWSSEMAYVLGLVYADGCVQCNKLYFQFSPTSLDILANIHDLMGSQSDPTQVDNNGFPSWRLTFASTEIVSGLEKIGLNPGKKSHSIKFPRMPVGCQRHFIRGYWDGDGNASGGQIRFSSVCLHFLEEIAGSLVRISEEVELPQIRLPNSDFTVWPLSQGSIYTQEATSHYPQGGSGVSISHTLSFCSGTDREIIYHLFYDDVPKGQFSVRKRQDFENKGLNFSHFKP